MAKLFNHAGYSVVETTNVAAVRNGRMVSQYEMSTALDTAGAQNGMLLAIDDIGKEVGLPANANAIVGLHASDERVYEEGKGLNTFIVKKPNLPRVMRLAIGDKFETNAVEQGGTDLDTPANAKAYLAGDPIYGIADATGNIKLSKTLAAEVVVGLQVVEFVTLPNGEEGIRFVVVKAGA